MDIKYLFDINLLIKKDISRQISLMKKLKNKSYYMDNLNNLVDNGTLESIKNKIKNFLKNSENIFKKILENYNSLIEKDFDFITYLKEKLVKLISDNVEKLIKKLMKNGYFVPCLFNKVIPPKLKNIIFSYINNINISENNSDDYSDDDLDEYLLGLKIPGSNLLFKNLLNLIKSYKTYYLNTENQYRSNNRKNSEKNEKEIILSSEDIHYEIMKIIKNKLLNEELFKEDIFHEYFHDILKDFFINNFFDINNKSDLSDKQIQFLEFLSSKKNINNKPLDRFLYLSLWFVNYHETIQKFLEIFLKIEKYFEQDKKNNNPNSIKLFLLDLLKDNYEFFFHLNKKESKNNKEEVNDIFFNISEAFCQVLTNINVIDLENIDLKIFCIDLNETAQILAKLNIFLKLKIKGQYSLLSIVRIIELGQKMKKDEKEFKALLKIFLKNIYDERKFLFKNQIDQAKKSLNEQIKIAICLSEEVSSKILVNKLLQNSLNEQYKYEIVRTIFQFPKLIKYSLLFFNYCFLMQPIKPMKQKKIMTDNDRNMFCNKFGEIENLEKNNILKEINNQAENNEILKEILLYIFELRLKSFFEECLKTKFFKNDNNRILLLTGLNLDYFKKASNRIKNNNFGKLKNLSIIFYFAYIRCYLYYFVNLQLKYKDLGDLSPVHRILYEQSNSNLGKMINLYIAKIFILMNKGEYFLDVYLNDEERNNRKNKIISEKANEIIFPIESYENSKHLLFNIYSCINTNINNINEKLVEKIELSDLYYIINFIFNEMIGKSNDKTIEISLLSIKMNDLKEKFNYDKVIKNKFIKLFEKISDSNFFKDENIKQNLSTIFYMIKFYILSFIGYENNLLFSSKFYDKVVNLIKIFYYSNEKDEMIFIESYYQMRKYFEEEYLINNNSYPVYVCNCGRWYSIKDSLPLDYIKCKCGLNIGGLNDILIEKDNLYEIYYDQKQKNFIEETILGKKKRKGKFLEEFKNEFIKTKIINKCEHLNEILLTDSCEINDITFPKEFLRFIFLSQIFIEYKISITNENEIKNEFNSGKKNSRFNVDDIFNIMINLDKNLEKYIISKNIDYNYFLNYSSDNLYNLFKNNDFLIEKDKIWKVLNNLLLEMKKKYKVEPKIEPDNLIFKKIEMNILTYITLNEDFKNDNLKYLLTVSQYPTLEHLKKTISLYKKKPLSILKGFISLDPKNFDIEKLSHIMK